MPQITVHGPWDPPVTYRFDQEVITIGRSETNDLMLLEPSLSRQHAEIRSQDGAWVLKDRGSRNGTFLNGSPVTAPLALRCGDEIGVGDMVLVFDAPLTGKGANIRETAARPLQARKVASEEPALVGESAALLEVRAVIDKIAPSSATVLVTGESGTGKELVARLLHRRSPRADKPFVVVNCPALPGSLLESELFGVERGVATGVEARLGRLETAQGGTLFLDEIGDLDLAAQAKILRFLQERTIERLGGRRAIPVDVRLIAATNHDLAHAMQRGTFRRDLYFRLNVVHVRLPPLRERPGDIGRLVEHFLQEGEARVTMDSAAIALLELYPFPGNVRELEHVVESARLMAGGEVIRAEHLPEVIRHHVDTNEDTATRGPAGIAASLRQRIVDGHESFWSVVQQPYLRREIPREAVKALIETAYAEAGRSYKGVAELFGIGAQHKKLLDFLRHHDLGVDKPP